MHMRDMFEFRKLKVENSLGLQNELLLHLLEENEISQENENAFCMKWIEENSAKFRDEYKKNPKISIEEMAKLLSLNNSDKDDLIRFDKAA